MSEVTKNCEYCGRKLPLSSFIKTKNPFFPSGRTNICTQCVEDILEQKKGSFETVDSICRWLDIPFDVDRWNKYYKLNGKLAITKYAELMYSESYPMLDWKMVNDSYLQLQEEERLDEAVPEIKQAKMNKLRKKWGEEYSDEDIAYMEDFYQGILQTQNVNGKIQTDDALKLCKISLILDRQIRDREDFDKTLKSYDLLRKSADFTPKNIKNGCDFDSVGELFAYCEKQGWENQFYDDTPRDTVDLVMKDTQAWLRNLYKNESSIPEDIQQRIEALKKADELEEQILATPEDDLDDFENEAYDMETFSEEAGL